MAKTAKEVVTSAALKRVVEQFRTPELVTAFLRNIDNEHFQNIVRIVEKMDDIGENKSFAMVVLALIHLLLGSNPNSPLAKFITEKTETANLPPPHRIALDEEAAINRFYTRLKDYDVVDQMLVLQFGLDINVQDVFAEVETDGQASILPLVDKQAEQITVTIPLNELKTARTAKLHLKLWSPEMKVGQDVKKEFNDLDSYDLMTILLQNRQLFDGDEALETLLDVPEHEAPGFQTQEAMVSGVSYRVAVPSTATELSQLPIGVKSSEKNQRYGIIVRSSEGKNLSHYGFDETQHLETDQYGKAQYSVSLPTKTELGTYAYIEVWLTRDRNQVKLEFPVLIESRDTAASTE